jgi:hypothetical protein
VGRTAPKHLLSRRLKPAIITHLQFFTISLLPNLRRIYSFFTIPETQKQNPSAKMFSPLLTKRQNIRHCEPKVFLCQQRIRVNQIWWIRRQVVNVFDKLDGSVDGTLRCAVIYRTLAGYYVIQ